MFIPRYAIDTESCCKKNGIILSDETENLLSQRKWIENALAMDVNNSSSNSPKSLVNPFDERGIMPHSVEYLALSKNNEIIPAEENWLEDALPIGIYLSKSRRLRELVNSIYKELENHILKSCVKISRKRYRDVLKNVIINLWLGYFSNKPISYSRNSNYYNRDSRYEKLFIKYDRLIKTIDTLEAIEYINQKKGFYNRDKNFGRTTRMWATQKLLVRFHNLRQPGFYKVAEPGKLIVLRQGGNHNKGIRYKTTPSIQRQKDELQQYNDFVKKHEITVNLNEETEVSIHFF